jgi:hypothetical protein
MPPLSNFKLECLFILRAILFQVRIYMEHLKEEQVQQQQQQQQRQQQHRRHQQQSELENVPGHLTPAVLSWRQNQSLLFVLCLIVVSSSLIFHLFPDPLGLRKSNIRE